MRKCPFNNGIKCEECFLFIENSVQTSVKPNGRCSIVKIALELRTKNIQDSYSKK